MENVLHRIQRNSSRERRPKILSSSLNISMGTMGRVWERLTRQDGQPLSRR